MTIVLKTNIHSLFRSESENKQTFKQVNVYLHIGEFYL